MKRTCRILSGLGIAVLFGSIISQKASAYPLNPQAPITFGGDMHMVDSADFNNDGNNDLVVTDGKSIRGIGILLGNGDGTFAAPQLVADGDPYEWGLDIADLNNDGYADIIVANGATSAIQIYMNDGTGTFLSFANYPVNSVGNGHGTMDNNQDVNSDGFVDVIVPGGVNEAFHLLLNDGAGNLLPPQTINSNDPCCNHEQTFVEDMNGDSLPDVAVSSTDGNTIEIFRGDGAGNFIYDHTISASQPYGIYVKDINNDSIPEIIYAQNNSDVIISDISGTVLAVISAGAPQYVQVDDINLDGNQDIIYSDNSVNGIRVVLGNGVGFDAPTDYLVNNEPLGLAIKDFDGDSLPDVAAVNHGNTLSIFLTETPSTIPDVVVTGSPAATEGGANGVFQVRLASNPSNVVTIAFSSTLGQSNAVSPGGGICFVPAGAGVNPGTPYDPCSTWNVSQNVYIEAIDDPDVEGTHSDQIKMAVTSKDTNYDMFAVANKDVVIYDNEIPPTPAINIVSSSPGEANVDEQGPTSDTFSISLEGTPSANVSVHCTVSDPSQVNFSPAVLDFIITPSNARPRQ